MNNINYEKPDIELLDFDDTDIVTISPNTKIPPDSDNYEGDIIKFNYQKP